MPPKKNIRKAQSTIKIEQKTHVKKKTPQQKPKLKKPTVIKVKSPLNKIQKQVFNCDTSNKTPTRRNKRKLPPDVQLELTNEVAQAQLVKHAIKFVPEPPAPDKPPAKKRGRKSKLEALPLSVSTMLESKVETVNDNEVSTPRPAISLSSDSEESPISNKTPKPHENRTICLDAMPGQNYRYTRQTSLRGFPVGILENPSAFEMPKRAKYARKTRNNTKSEEQVDSTIDANENSPLKKKWIQSKITDMKMKISLKKKNSNTASAAKVTNRRKLDRTVKSRGIKNGNSIAVVNSPSILDQNVGNTVPIKEELKTGICKSPVHPGGINSRKTSMSSTSTSFSWTKDISNSSTTTCITASTSDFVRIDNKLPEIKLTNIRFERQKLIKRQASLDSESSDSSVENTTTKSSVPADDGHSLNLSTSSLSTAKSPRNPEVYTAKQKKAMTKLISGLKNIDLEMINWVGYPNEKVDMNCKEIKDVIFKLYEYESCCIVQAQHLENITQDEVPLTVVEKKITYERDEDNFVKPSINLTKNHKIHETEKVRTTEPSRAHTSEKSCAEDNYNHSFSNYQYGGDNYDDDDALSLFAESLTGMESSRLASVRGSPPHTANIEEYIPKPIVNVRRLSYNPTKIICEKQNADSTSINKDLVEQVAPQPNIEVANKLPSIIDKFETPNPPNNRTPSIVRPRLVTSMYKVSPGWKSHIFKGLCFFNLSSFCKNTKNCRFSHFQPQKSDVKTALHNLDDVYFIQEYIRMREWSNMRRKYGFCFVEECKRREMTQLLLEMAIDFVVKCTNMADDIQIKLQVLEYVLLYLNTVNLFLYEDLLLFSVHGCLLCDVFIQTIANTQNFSRFKSVFIALTNFIIKHGKSFTLDVASKILERITILPYDEAASCSMVNIIDKTDTYSIFKNFMMVQFENKLSASNLELYRQLLSIKDKVSDRDKLEGGNMTFIPSPRPPSTGVEECMQAVPSTSYAPPYVPEPEEPSMSLMYTENEQRYTSPDTTHLDNMNKIEEPIITRTINFDHTKSYTTANFNGSNSSESETNSPNHRFQRWRGRGNQFRRAGYFNPAIRGRGRGHMRPMARQVTYGANPTKYHQHSGPNYY